VIVRAIVERLTLTREDVVVDADIRFFARWWVTERWVTVARNVLSTAEPVGTEYRKHAPKEVREPEPHEARPEL
jgi:hypothetical protein